MSLSPFELPDRVQRAVESIPTGGINVRKAMHILLKPFLWVAVGFYAAWTAWMVELLPNPLAVMSLALQGFSLWYWVMHADELRIVCGMKETQKPTRTRDSSSNPIMVMLFFAGLPAFLGIVFPFLTDAIDQDFLVGLDKDPRHKLVVALVICFKVYHFDPARGKTDEERLRALVEELDTALAYPGIGRLVALTPEHEDLYARLRSWPSNLPQSEELRELMNHINAALDDLLD